MPYSSSDHSDQPVHPCTLTSLCCPLQKALVPWLSIGHGLIWVFAGRTCHDTRTYLNFEIRQTTWGSPGTCNNHLNLNLRKRTFCAHNEDSNQPAHARSLIMESSLSAWRNFVSLDIQKALREDSDQPARMRRLIWIFAERTHPTVHFLMSWLI